MICYSSSSLLDDLSVAWAMAATPDRYLRKGRLHRCLLHAEGYSSRGLSYAATIYTYCCTWSMGRLRKSRSWSRKENLKHYYCDRGSSRAAAASKRQSRWGGILLLPREDYLVVARDAAALHICALSPTNPASFVDPHLRACVQNLTKTDWAAMYTVVVCSSDTSRLTSQVLSKYIYIFLFS